ncbi:MAG: hypothetical protein WC869_09000 [Phycisphaerae bacterium]|jgi:2-polyprenyl-6-methoxyphenol hydroxylase-like FAD-dependent oxidoreductase
MLRLHDIAILGGTPAGYAAAYYLAKKKCDVVVLDVPQQGAQCPLADWVSADFFHLPHLPRDLAKACKAQAFKTVVYHSNDLSRTAEQRSASNVGHFLQTSELTRVLAAAAKKAGAKIRTSTTPPAIRLDEDHVELVGSAQVAARLLIFVQGRPNDALGDLALPARTIGPSPLVVAGLDCHIDEPLDGALHVLELPERTELGVFFCVGNLLHLRVISSSAASLTRAAELSAMVSVLQRGKLLPTNLPLGRARGAVWRPPAGMALELETHLAKRSVLAGTAGGFAEAITGQALVPTVASAILAAEAGLAALGTQDVQDALTGYEKAWRKQLEGRLRPPTTPFQMLLPLMFANKKVAQKLTQALLTGEGI